MFSCAFHIFQYLFSYFAYRKPPSLGAAETQKPWHQTLIVAVVEAARPLLEDFLASCDYLGLEWLAVDLDGWKLGKAEKSIWGILTVYLL